jgi:uncharacterized repeat protein (TIGR03803 family)
MVRKLVLALALVCGLGFMANSAQAQSASFKVLHEFAGVGDTPLLGDGSTPEGDLIKVGDLLYGTTFLGGYNTGNCYYVTCGTVYSFNLVTGVEQVVYAFRVGGGTDVTGGSSPNGGLTHIGDMLYGTLAGGIPFTIKPPIVLPSQVFSVDTKSGVEKAVHLFTGQGDGRDPAGETIKVAGIVYGTTVFGGSTGYGTVFALNPKTGAEKVLYSFKGGADGAEPSSTLLNADGMFYGTTQNGGNNPCDCGTVFVLNPKTGAEKVLYRFQGGSDGNSPSGRLYYVGGSDFNRPLGRLHYFNPILYGMTSFGGTGDRAKCGASGCGTIFAVNVTTGAETILYSFGGGLDGAYPDGGLTELRGKLYGVTGGGGNMVCQCGTIFSLDMTSGTEKVLYAFTGTGDGAYPSGSLLKVDGSLYGTTSMGGAGNLNCGSEIIGPCGTLFEITP